MCIEKRFIIRMYHICEEGDDEQVTIQPIYEQQDNLSSKTKSIP